MKDSANRWSDLAWLWRFPPAHWLAEYRAPWLCGDAVAGVTPAAYAIPVSLAYAGLAGLPPQTGVYGYLLGGLGYALFGLSRQLAIGPTSAISLMIAGTVGAMADGDAQRYAQIASLTGFTVAVPCLIAWVLRLSVLVKLISDSILVGFKAGAGLTIAMTQLPTLLGLSGGGHNSLSEPCCWLVNSATSITLCSPLVRSPSCYSCWASACYRANPSHSALLRCQSSLHRYLGLPILG
jgi:SulP family sulfate permease